MDRNPMPGIALRQRADPVLRGFPLVDDRDHCPGNAGAGGDGLIARFGIRRDEMFCDGGEIAREPGVRPAPRIRCPKRDQIGHYLLAVGLWWYDAAMDRRSLLQTLGTATTATAGTYWLSKRTR